MWPAVLGAVTSQCRLGYYSQNWQQSTSQLQSYGEQSLILQDLVTDPILLHQFFLIIHIDLFDVLFI